MKRFHLLTVVGLFFFSITSKASWSAWDSIYAHDNSKAFAMTSKTPAAPEEYFTLHVDLPINMPEPTGGNAIPGKVMQQNVTADELRAYIEAPGIGTKVPMMKFLDWWSRQGVVDLSNPANSVWKVPGLGVLTAEINTESKRLKRIRFSVHNVPEKGDVTNMVYIL